MPLVEFMYLVFTRVPLVEFMYLIFTRVSDEGHRRQFGSMLCSSDFFRVLINSLSLSLSVDCDLMTVCRPDATFTLDWA